MLAGLQRLVEGTAIPLGMGGGAPTLRVPQEFLSEEVSPAPTATLSLIAKGQWVDQGTLLPNAPQPPSFPMFLSIPSRVKENREVQSLPKEEIEFESPRGSYKEQGGPCPDGFGEDRREPFTDEVSPLSNTKAPEVEGRIPFWFSPRHPERPPQDVDMGAAGAPEASQKTPLYGTPPPYPWTPDPSMPTFTSTAPEFVSNLPPMVKPVPENGWEEYEPTSPQPGTYHSGEYVPQEAYAPTSSFTQSQEERDEEFREWEKSGERLLEKGRVQHVIPLAR